MKQTISIVDGVLTCEYPEIKKVFKVKLADYSKEIYVQCDSADHGMMQKYGDAKSGQTAEEKFAEVQLIHASLLDGTWKRTANVDLTPIICEAVSRLQKKYTLAQLLKAAPANEKQVKEWKADAKVKAEIAKIRAERAAKLAAESTDELVVDLK